MRFRLEASSREKVFHMRQIDLPEIACNWSYFFKEIAGGLAGSSTLRIWSARTSFRTCAIPLGQRISMLWATASVPNPK